MKSWTTKDGRKINIRKQMGNKHLQSTLKMILDNATRHADLEIVGDEIPWKWQEYFNNYLNAIPAFRFLWREAIRRKLIK